MRQQARNEEFLEAAEILTTLCSPMTALKESNLSENKIACIRKKPSIPVSLGQVLRKCMGLGFLNFFKLFETLWRNF